MSPSVFQLKFGPGFCYFKQMAKWSRMKINCKCGIHYFSWLTSICWSSFAASAAKFEHTFFDSALLLPHSDTIYLIFVLSLKIDVFSCFLGHMKWPRMQVPTSRNGNNVFLRSHKERLRKDKNRLRYDTAFLAISTPQLQTPKLVNVIKLDKVWWQNHDLHWILHPKKHLKLFGGLLFLRGSPPEIQTFSWSNPERLERGPQYSDRRSNFKKSLRTIVVL